MHAADCRHRCGLNALLHVRRPVTSVQPDVPCSDDLAIHILSLPPRSALAVSRRQKRSASRAATIPCSLLMQFHY